MDYMSKKVAEKQADYALGPPWLFKGSALYQLHLVKAEIARTFIPKEFKLVEAFGYTLGGFFLAHYDDSPDAMFDELVVIAGIVWNRPTSCAWAARVLVSSHDACSHGRKIVWFVDGIPIRVSRNYESIGIAYPNKQGMRVYSSIWNADYWATRSGLEKINWKILCVERATSQKEIKKAYYKLALRLHPDKNPGDEEAKEKFQLLQKVISILGDEEKRTLYDQTGCVDDGALSREAAENLQEFFRTLYNKVTEADIEEFEANYRGSDSDKNDLKELYTKFKGNMNRIFCSMLCSEPKLDSHRFKDIIDEAIAEGELKTTKAYQKWANQVSEMNPPADPTVRRPKLKKREETDLVAAITRHRGERKDAFNSIISSVMRQCILSC